MEKQALLSTLMNVSEAVDGAKKVKTAYNTPTNKYDSLMGTTISKNVPKQMGMNNASIGKGISVRASEELDLIYKQASRLSAGKAFKRYSKQSIDIAKDGIKKLPGVIDKIDMNNSKHIKNMFDSAKNKDIKKTLKSGVQAAKVTVPTGLAMVGAGAGATKLMKHLDKKPAPDKDIEYNTIGAGITAGMALGAISKKRMLGPFSDLAKLTSKAVSGYPLKSVTQASKAGKIVVDTAKNVGKTIQKVNNVNKSQMLHVGKSIDKFMNGKNPVNAVSAKKLFMKQEQSNFFVNAKLQGMDIKSARKAWAAQESNLSQMADNVISKFYKNASDELDDLVKLAGSKSDYAKSLFVDHFIGEGLKSIPYVAFPAAASAAIGINLKNGLKKNKSDINNENEKVAFSIPFPNKINKEKAIRYGKIGLERGVDGLGRTVFPAAVMAVTGRNITNSFEKLNDNDKNNMQENMANRIIIQINGGDSKRKIKKDISNQLDNALSKQASHDIGAKRVQEELEKKLKGLVLNLPKLKSRKIHVGNGLRKEFRMHQ